MAEESAATKITLKSSDGESFEIDELVAAAAKITLKSSDGESFEIDELVAAAAAKITLKSSDGKFFEIDELVAMESKALKNMIDDNCANSTIPLPNVNAKILSKVIDYCTKHVEAAAKLAGDDKAEEEALKKWDAEFVNVDQATLFDLILASNYLNVKGLLDLTCQAVADMIKEKTPDEIRTLFNIKNDFTPEEEEEIQKENQLAFE